MAALTSLIVTINICGIISDTKISLLNSFIQQHQYDIVLLQEVSVSNFNFFGYKEIINVGPERRGTALLFKENLPIAQVVKLPCGRGIAAKFGHVNVLNIYAPSGSHNRQARSLFFAVDILPLFANVVDDIILAGDFNSVLRDTDTTGHANICGSLRALWRAFT